MQTGLGVAVVAVIVGCGAITTLVVAGTLGQPFSEAMKVYVPLATKEVLGMLGFCTVLLNPLGPVQENTAPTSVVPVRFSV